MDVIENFYWHDINQNNDNRFLNCKQDFTAIKPQSI